MVIRNPIKKGLSTFCAIAALLASAATGQAANITWDGGIGGTGTSWNSAVNWSPDVLPGSSDRIFFNNTGTGSGTKVISLDANQSVFSLNINPYSTAPTFTIGSAADNTAGYSLTLTNLYRGDNNSGTQTVAANVTLAGDSIWNIINGYSGSVSVTGVVGSASAVTFTKEGSNNLTLSGANTFTGNVRSVGGGLILSGTNAYTGTTAATGGNVTLNFSAATATDVVNSASSLVLGGTRGSGSLTVNGRNLANVVNSQTFNGLTLEAGGSMNIVNGIASGKTLVALGAITRNAGSSLTFTQPTVNTTISNQNGFTTSTGNDASGILGGYATIGGNDWAYNNSTNIVAYTGYTTLAGATPNIIDGANTNVNITAGSTGDIGQAAGTVTVNTLRVNDATARTVTIGAGNILRLGAVGGILTPTGTGALIIGASGNAGTLTAGGSDDTAGEIVVTNATAVTINSVIANNGSGAVALTKAGVGTLTLNSANTYTGGSYVNAGTLALLPGSTDILSTSGKITVAGGTLNLGASTNQTTSGAVVLANGTLSNGTLTKSGTNYDVRNGSISTKLAGSVGLDKTTSGALSFANTAANTFTGDTTITEGSVTGSSAASVVSISGNLIVGSLTGTNGASYSNSGSNVNFSSGKNVTVYSNGVVNFGSGAQNLSGTLNIIGGSVAGSQIYNNNATWNLTGGTLTGNFYLTGATYNILASSSTSTVGIGTAAGSQTFNVADGAAALDLAYTGSLGGALNLTKNGAGTMHASGSSAYTGITTVSGGTLSVATLSNGGSNSSIGASAVAATNLRLANGTTLKYTGTGHSTDRLFTVNGTAAGDSATLEASGTGAVNFTGTGNLAYGTTAQTRTLKLGGTSTADNTLAALIGNNGGAAVSVTKQDAGTWILSGTNTYTGATTINGGTMSISGAGSINNTSGVTVNSGGTFRYNSSTAFTQSLTNNGGSVAGSGNLGAIVLSGSGSVDPGNSPGIMTAGGTDPTGGLDYNFEFTLANAAPTWSSASNSGNDVLRLTDGSTPLVAALASGSNTISLYLNVGSLTSGDVFTGGFFTDKNASFLSSISGADIDFYLAGTGSTSYNGLNTYGLYSGALSFDLSTVQVGSADFAGGTVLNGYVMEFTAVPEPSTCILLGLGLGALCFRRRRQGQISL